MLKRIVDYVKQSGVGAQISSLPINHQLNVYRLIGECPICQGDYSKCQSNSKTCRQPWQVFAEANKLDIHDPDKVGSFLFEENDHYWKVIIKAVDDPRFTTWGNGGCILKKGQQSTK